MELPFPKHECTLILAKQQGTFDRITQLLEGNDLRNHVYVSPEPVEGSFALAIHHAWHDPYFTHQYDLVAGELKEIRSEPGVRIQNQDQRRVTPLSVA